MDGDKDRSKRGTGVARLPSLVDVAAVAPPLLSSDIVLRHLYPKLPLRLSGTSLFSHSSVMHNSAPTGATARRWGVAVKNAWGRRGGAIYAASCTTVMVGQDGDASTKQVGGWAAAGQ